MNLRSIKPYIPERVLPLARYVYSMYMRGFSWYTGLWDRCYTEMPGTRLPPASLRYRVHGSPNADAFLKVGRKCSEDIVRALERVGRNFDSFQNILDFGCGCGRTLLWFTDRPRTPRLYGTDIDAEAISWCRENIGSAEFSVNDALPPLAYPSEMFDLIYAISVFTHLDEDYQFRWLDELRRVARPGGIVLLTIHGHYSWKDFPRKHVAEIESKGFKFITSNAMKGIFPEWYQDMYHSEEYIRDRYSRYFEVLDYIPRGMGSRQDVVVLLKS